MKTKKLLQAMLCLCAVFCLIYFYSDIKPEIIQSLKIWSAILIPAMFPYMVISQYAVGAGYMKHLSRIVSPFLQPFFKISKKGMEIYICSLVCGYPSGAICANSLYESGEISESEAMRIICLTANAGPLFLISAIGSDMLSNTSDGIALYAIQTLSCIIAAIITAPFSKATIPSKLAYAKQEKSDLCTCIRNSVTSTVNIGGFMVAVSVMCKIILTLFQKIPFAFSEEIKSFCEILVYSIFEVSRGSLEISKLAQTNFSFALICAACVWGGLCVMMQIKSVLNNNFKTGYLIKFKFLQASLAFVAGYVYKLNSPYHFLLMKTNIFFYALIVSVILFLVYTVNTHESGKRKRKNRRRTI